MKFPFSKNELFFAAVYFVQAAVGISGIAQFLFTRNELGLDFVQLGVLGALGTIAWSIKPIYGFLTDLVPIFGYRRRIYLHFAPLVTIASWLYIWAFADSFVSYAIPITLAGVGLGFTDVICDGLVVQQCDKNTAGRYQSICWGSLTVGAIITGFLSGLLLEREIVSIRGMFFITAMMPLITFGLSFLIKERRISDRAEIKVHQAISPRYIAYAVVAFVLTILMLIPREGVSQAVMSLSVLGIWFAWFALYFKHLIDLKVIGRSIFAAGLFIFLWRFTPSFGAPWQDYYLNQIGIDQETFGFFGVIGNLGWLVGTLLFAKYFDRTPIKKLLVWTIVIASILGISQLTLTTEALANQVGVNPIIHYGGSILATPVFLIAKGGGFWAELYNMPGIVHLNFFLDFFLGIMYMISFLALLKFVALSTPRNLEGTNFAVMASIMNFGLVFGSISGGYIYEQIQGGFLGMNGLQITVWLGAITSLIALLVVPYIKTDHMAHEGSKS